MSSESDDHSAPEYSDDDSAVKKPKEKKPAKEVKEEAKEDKSEIQLPSQIGYKRKESQIPPPPEPTDKKKQFLGRPRRIQRNENYSRNEERNTDYAEKGTNDFGERRYRKPFEGESRNGKPSEAELKPKNKTMVSTNCRPALEGSDDLIPDDINIYYQSSHSAKHIQPCVNPTDIETFVSFVKSPDVPESRQFLDARLVENLVQQKKSKLRPVQIAMLTAIFSYSSEHPETSNADILCTSKTGSGKTLAFLVPILQKAIERRELQPIKEKRTPLALIFVNSAELAMSVFQVAKSLLRHLGLRLVVMAATLNFVEHTNFDIGICTNGRFQNHFSGTLTLGDSAVVLDLSQLEYIVIDEVDKMASDSKFVAVLDQLKNEPKKPRIFGLSATIDADTTRIIRFSSVFQIKCGQHNVVPPNIKQFYWEVKYQSISRVYRIRRGKAGFRGAEIRPMHPFDTLYKALTEYPILKGKRIMVFVKRTRIADFISLRLREYGIPVVSIHKKLKDIQTPINMFNNGVVDIAIVTQYFTRGIDTEVDVVINYDLPLIATDYIHRCGRTGRNGNQGIAITFIDLLDPENYNPEVVDQIVKSLAKDENAVIPDFLEQRVADFKKWDISLEL